MKKEGSGIWDGILVAHRLNSKIKAYGIWILRSDPLVQKVQKKTIFKGSNFTLKYTTTLNIVLKRQ